MEIYAQPMYNLFFHTMCAHVGEKTCGKGTLAPAEAKTFCKRSMDFK